MDTRPAYLNNGLGRDVNFVDALLRRGYAIDMRDRGVETKSFELSYKLNISTFFIQIWGRIPSTPDILQASETNPRN
jgi:hypothetical protein